MGQFFAFVNVDKGQTSGDIGKWAPVNGCDIASWISTCERPLPLEDSLEQSLRGLRAGRPTEERHLGVLCMLPSEVIALIFEELSDFDFVMFAITNSQLFAIAYTQYVARVAEFRAPWAFDRIILVGDESSDLPDTFLSEAEHTALFDSSDEDRLYKIAEATFECMSQRCFLDDSVRLRQLSTNFGRREDYYNAVSLTTGMSLLFTTIRPRVLINVSTNEYIRQTKATPFNGILPLLAAYGYPDGRRYEEDPCYGSQRGPWAGHQLAVVSQEDHQKMMQADEEPWEDITDIIAGLYAPVLVANQYSVKI